MFYRKMVKAIRFSIIKISIPKYFGDIQLKLVSEMCQKVRSLDGKKKAEYESAVIRHLDNVLM